MSVMIHNQRSAIDCFEMDVSSRFRSSACCLNKTKALAAQKYLGNRCIQEIMNDRLRLLSGNEPLMLDHTDGWETLAQATDVFRYIDSNFKLWRCDVAAQPTKETAVQE